ncbi:MAG: hypothetical protein NZ926_02600 [Candidatus Methanomethylicia archaeon]|nr:hypothetical protein [Candidatus Methanomethylicia archaeon]MCX8169196.1 hypothetical protein [Candidatus Methanomethylicia archaeon]MDW7989022.1 hypothetical protein [Nitrososphaerota archaeon]
MSSKRKVKSSSRNTKIFSIIVLFLILIGISAVFFMSLPEKVEVKAKFNTISLYLSGDHYRICLVYSIENPKPYGTRVYVTLDLRDAGSSLNVMVSNVIGIFDNSTRKFIQYEFSGNYILKFTLEMSANEVKTILILL